MIEKIVLTGAPGSGKSSTIRILEYDYGERTIAEAAEDMIKTLRKRGYEKPWELSDFQDNILELQLQREQQVKQLEGRVFIDRGILDGLAYHQLRGQKEAMKWAIENARGRYSKVFLMERGTACEKNGIRFENPEEAQKLEDLQYQNYTNAGYKVERIPFIKPEERARMIIKICGEKNEMREERI
jgi:predicted ATPase